MANLREEILRLTNPAPVFKDPEDESDDETTARLEDHDEDDSADIQEPSNLRRRAATITLDTDGRYAGKKTSRSKLGDDFLQGDVSSSEDGGGSDNEQDSGDDDMNSDEEDDDDGEGSDDGSEDHEDIAGFQSKFKSDSNGTGFTFSNDGDFGKYGEEEEGDDSEEEEGSSDSEESAEDNQEDMSDVEDDDEDGIQKFSAAGSEEVLKGKAAKQQLGLWDSLLEGRIKLQKAVSVINQLPQHNTWSHFAEESEEFTDEAEKTQTAIKHLLDSLLHLQDILLAQNSDTKHMLDDGKTKPKKRARVDDDEEEIPSDSDMEEEESEEKVVGNVRKRKLKMPEYPDFMAKRHDSFLAYRNNTIQRWYDKTRLAAGSVKGKSFSALDQSALAQINQILGDKDRLLRRSQLKRSVYRVLGNEPKREDPEIIPSDNSEERLKTREHLKDYDEEIFDDDDFYHQMLRELIEKKTMDINDPVALSRQWLEIQKLRTKNKKTIDTKASKGRKVRYEVHKKLVNFMAPLDNCEWSHEARDDLFKSLFGKRFATAESGR